MLASYFILWRSNYVHFSTALRSIPVFQSQKVLKAPTHWFPTRLTSSVLIHMAHGRHSRSCMWSTHVRVGPLCPRASDGSVIHDATAAELPNPPRGGAPPRGGLRLGGGGELRLGGGGSAGRGAPSSS